MANAPTPSAELDQLESLLSRWQTSLDLHAKYAALDDTRYWHVQPWPKHERPQRWIIQLARKRILALQRLVAQRQAEGDRAFIEGIEIMSFLATLVGLTNVERFIPLATNETERRDVLTAKPREKESRTAENRKVVDSTARTAEQRRTAETTRQMPALPNSRKRDPNRPATVKPKKAPTNVTQMEHVVIADAVRLLGWGRQWHEVAEMISRLSERPAPSEIRRILRTYRDQIDAVANKRRE
jgi:hypothetical protein